MHFGAARVWFLVGVSVHSAGCGLENDNEPATIASRTPIINGSPVVGDAGGVLELQITTPYGTHPCSSVQLNNTWLLTAKHCVDKVARARDIWYFREDRPDYNAAFADQYLLNEVQDVALVHFPSGDPYYALPLFSDNGLHLGLDAELVGRPLTCFGYGWNAFGTGGGVLRSAVLTPSTVGRSPCGLYQTDCYPTDGYFMPTNIAGQVLAEGDSGGPCFLDAGGERVVTGITNTVAESGGVDTGTWQAGAQHFREWVRTNTGVGGSCPSGYFMTDLGTCLPGPTTGMWRTLNADGDPGRDIVQLWPNNGRLGMVLYNSTGQGLQGTWGTGDVGEGYGALAWLTGDVNSDGRSDVIQPWNNNGRLGLFVYLSNGSRLAHTWKNPDMGQGSAALAWLTGDVNADGRVDVIQPWDHSGRLGINVFSSNGSGFDTTWSTGDAGQGSGALAFLAGDQNGDGHTDIIQPWDSGGRLGMSVYSASMTQAGWGYVATWASPDLKQGSKALTWLTGDVNGDGRTDVIQPFVSNNLVGLIVYTAEGAGYRASWGQTGSVLKLVPRAWLTGDINADGKTDLIQPFDNNGQLGFYVYTSAQTQAGPGLVYTWGTVNIGQGSNALAWLSQDVDGDGRSDVVQIWDKGGGRLGFIVYRSNGIGLEFSWAG